MNKVTVEPNKNPMAGTWSKAAQVRKALKGGRPRQKDKTLSSTRAILEASILLDGMRSAMSEAGLSEDDVAAAIVFLGRYEGSVWVQLYAVPFVSELPGLCQKVSALAGAWKPLGVVCQQRDEAAKTGMVAWVHPWLTDSESARALIVARDFVAKGEGPFRVN